MTKEELDLWSNMNNPNNSANIDDWANLHNPNNKEYSYNDEDDELETNYSRDYVGYKIIKNKPIDKIEITTIELIKEAIKNTSGDKGYSFMSEISLYIAHLKKPTNCYKANSNFIKQHSSHFKTFFLEHYQSNMAVQIRE
ncbi:hypothetical protein O8C83_11020 [Aliarcobacter butzleri]|uniref:hypothetical protein n=1 Tax=Aliarcobacter butzleri TaxID=28197 RepID=UPI00263D9082|nr:hypothetical protein [Aliarcobacter butzleri]MDN5101348.1 hypothetical protein [Aliarcobacter butzleri]